MENSYSKGGSPTHFSEVGRNQILERIKSEEFRNAREVMEEFGVSRSTVQRWNKRAGYHFKTCRDVGDEPYKGRTEGMDKTQQDKLREKWKDHPFVEPDPGVESFKTEKDALEYYKLRAEYLENLYMLADSPTRYLREEACTLFIASVPTTWDETRIAVDYKKQVQQVTPSTQLTLHLVRNGGWCGSIE